MVEKHPALFPLLSCLRGAEKLERQRASHGVPQRLRNRRKGSGPTGHAGELSADSPRSGLLALRGVSGSEERQEPRSQRDAGREPQRAGVWLVLGRKGGKQGREGRWGGERRVHWF